VRVGVQWGRAARVSVVAGNSPPRPPTPFNDTARRPLYSLADAPPRVSGGYGASAYASGIAELLAAAASAHRGATKHMAEKPVYADDAAFVPIPMLT
jgi:hypothetical protein